ncbi:type III-A CRISPR-associated RAMP protein Csm5 [Thermoplasma sp. Kam2015]|uniref:type III-A CRISPR-associated RAMP protein Csm5 n=1 Tax=Thermoplasma sp. Kam2015 TaxID=2094122 RepID=UPI000D93E130|nr:type III-A CRISPR-associated RAMP protein Csm5 [Thermoplasma sp. Kam2015]PYB67574.1 type III-A CRISPR-associated RAMP protein Csm5 [Thermoplasma sp. Kam2015]
MKITLEVNTPILIWDGINRTTFEVFEGKNGASIYDVYRAISTMPLEHLEKMKSLLEDLIKKSKNEDVTNLNEKINKFWEQVKDKVSDSIIYDNVKVESKDFRNKGNIIVHAHTGFPGNEKPYIPGSSVKGAMLTGIIVQAAISSSADGHAIKANLDKIYDLIKKAQLKVKSGNRTLIYSYALGRAFRFSDFMPVGEYKLSIMTVERRNNANVKGGIPNVGVFLTSGKFEGEFLYDRVEMITFLDKYDKSEDSDPKPFPFENFFKEINDENDAYNKMIEGIKYIDQKWAGISNKIEEGPIITLGRYRGARAMAVSKFIAEPANTMWFTQSSQRPGQLIIRR